MTSKFKQPLNNLNLGQEALTINGYKAFITASIKTASGRQLYLGTHQHGTKKEEWCEVRFSDEMILSTSPGQQELYSNMPKPDFLGLEIGFQVSDKLTGRKGILTAMCSDNYGVRSGTVFFSRHPNSDCTFENFPIKDLAFHGLGIFESIKELKTKNKCAVGDTVTCILRGCTGLIIAMETSENISELTILHKDTDNTLDTFNTFSTLIEKSTNQILDSDLTARLNLKKPAGCSITPVHKLIIDF